MDGNDKFKRTFDSYFGGYKNVPVGIYGIGQNAEIILNNAEGYHFPALIAAEHIGETRYGKEIISIEEAAEKTQMILIAAAPASTSIIYQRIRHLIPEEIPVFDMRGYRLTGEEYYKKNPYWKQSPAELMEQIDRHSVISFDMFDTLVTRRVFWPADVFQLVERALHDQGVNIPFARWRISAEQICGKETVSPSVDMIYESLRREYALDETGIQLAKELELRIEKQVLLPRKAMADIFRYALKKGKAVYLTSDMYYPKETIQNLLETCGITGCHDTLISCDWGASKKTGGLYEILKAKAPENDILHIGDHREADIKQAVEHGVDSYQVMSGRDMLSSSSAAYLVDSAKSFDDRLLLGTMIADLCNAPFSLHGYEGKLQINSCHELALFFLPITGLFFSFITSQASRYDAVLFPSRDGFFLHKLYCKAREERQLESLPEAFYFYASRSAVSSAAVFNEKDILVFCSKLFVNKGLNLREFLRNQFQIEVSEEYDITSGEAVEEWGKDGLRKKLLSNKAAIFEKSEKNRRLYLQYIHELGVDRFEKIAIVDIVTHGTLVYGLSNILGRQVHLIALGTSALPNDYVSNLQFVSSVWGNINEKWHDSVYSLSDVSQLHLFLEMLYASEEGQFGGFSESGCAVTVPGTEYNAELLRDTQNELSTLIKNCKDIHWEAVSKEFALSAMRMLYSKHTDMAHTLRAKFSFSDPYDGNTPICNLMDGLG